MYNVEWSTHPWLQISEKNPDFENTIFINCSTVANRIPLKDTFQRVFSSFGDADIRFLTQSEKDYETFTQSTGYQFPCVVASSLEELIICIHSCKKFIGNLSAPLAFAHAMHKPNITLLQSPTVDGIHQLSMNRYNNSIQIEY